MKILENYIAPTEHSQGDVGDIWIDKSTGDVYKCTGLTGSAKDLGYIAIGADATNTKYIWEKAGASGGAVKVTTFYLEEIDAYYLYHDMEMTRKVSKAECVAAAESGAIFINIAWSEARPVGTIVYATNLNPETSDEDYAEILAYTITGGYIEPLHCHTSEYVFNPPV